MLANRSLTDRMSSTRRLVRNVIATGLTLGVLPALAMVLIVGVARMLGVDHLGSYVFLTTLFTVLQVSTSMGLSVLLTRQFSVDRAGIHQYYPNATVVGVGLAAACGLASTVTVYLFDYPQEVVVANALMSLGLLPSAICGLNEAIFRAHERNVFITYTSVGEAVVKGLASFAFMFMGYGLIALALVHTLCRFMAAIAGAGLVARYFFFPLRAVKWATCWTICRQVPVFGGTYALGIIFTSIDMLLISKLASAHESGLYSAALKIGAMLKVFPDSLVYVLFPILARTFIEDHRQFHQIGAKGIQIVGIVVLPLTLLLTWWAPTILEFLFGASYRDAGPSLQILAWGIVATAWHSLMGTMLVAANKERLALGLLAIAVLLNIVLSAALIGWFHAVGAAVASVLANILLMEMCRRALQADAGTGISGWVLAKPLLAAAIAGAIGSLGLQVHPAVASAVSLVMYAVILVGTGTLRRDDVQLARRLLHPSHLWPRVERVDLSAESHSR